MSNNPKTDEAFEDLFPATPWPGYAYPPYPFQPPDLKKKAAEAKEKAKRAKELEDERRRKEQEKERQRRNRTIDRIFYGFMLTCLIIVILNVRW